MARERALAEVAGRLARVGRAARRGGLAIQAVKIADGIEDRRVRARALAEVAADAGQAGQAMSLADRVISTATGMRDPQLRRRALAEVAVRLAKGGLADQAISTAIGIEDLGVRARTSAKVAVRLSQSGQINVCFCRLAGGPGGCLVARIVSCSARQGADLTQSRAAALARLVSRVSGMVFNGCWL
jgi:hypothetical protein